MVFSLKEEQFNIITSPVAPQESDQGLCNDTNLCFRCKMEIELSYSHDNLEITENEKKRGSDKTCVATQSLRNSCQRLLCCCV